MPPTAAGLDDQTTVCSFYALYHYVLGFVVVEASPPTAPGALAEALRLAQAEPSAAPDPGERAHMTVVGPTQDELMTEQAIASDAQFTYGLKLLLRALEPAADSDEVALGGQDFGEVAESGVVP